MYSVSLFAYIIRISLIRIKITYDKYEQDEYALYLNNMKYYCVLYYYYILYENEYYINNMN